MGDQRALQAIAALTVALGAIGAIGAPFGALGVARADSRAERTALIDLGPDDPAIRDRLVNTIAGAGLARAVGDGVEDALVGQRGDLDQAPLALAIGAAQRAFGALDCSLVATESTRVIGIGASRQAAKLAVPELVRAWTYSLLCADRTGDVDAALRAASMLRKLGGSRDVPADLWRKYPEVDTTATRELLPLEIRSEIDGAEIWIDFERAGTSPLRTMLPAGPHVIGSASGTRRGWASGIVIRSQSSIVVPMRDQRGPWAHVGERIAEWRGKPPTARELAWVLDEVNARVAIIRHGTTIEAWGRAGRAELPYRLGGEDGRGSLDELDRVLAIAVDRVRAWNERAPDPDRPLLVETEAERARRAGRSEEPTQWWVYATIIGALSAAVIVVVAHENVTDTQRVELHAP